MIEAPGLAVVRRTARNLGPLRAEVVFLGGAVVPILLTDPSVSEPRATEDIDVVVEVSSALEYHEVTASLLKLGYSPDMREGAPICRLVRGSDVLDVMPQRPDIIGFSNRWYPAAIESAWECEIEPGVVIRVANPAVWLATKIEAFAGRGRRDFQASRDIEDVVAVIDGRPELVADVPAAREDVRDFLRQTLASWLDDDDFVQAIGGHLTGDEASQARLPIVRDRMTQLAGR